ncbi:MAG: 50S ribosomal protein L18 [Candidatus Kerfeldbacteria bacterium]|nr:50S ribosomal protein L18 [Candidatus Kerfeldbacteria bacterium]
MTKKQQQRLLATRTRRTARTRQRVRGTPARPRLAVFRSLRHIEAQLIDDTRGITLAAASDRELKKSEGPMARAHAVGALLADKAKHEQVTAAVFDRRGLRYHGRVKALADGARAGGLQF